MSRRVLGFVVVAYWLLAIGYIVYWLLAIGYWLLAIGYWLAKGQQQCARRV
jgi:hypothetical protein